MDADVLDRIDMHSLGQELQQARKRKGLTQEEAAKEIDATRTTMVAIEQGSRRIRAGELIKLARAYGRSVNDFVRQRPELESFNAQFRGPFKLDQQDEEAINPFIIQLHDLCRNYFELEQITNSPLVRRYPPEYLVKGLPIETAAENVALEERNRLGLGDGPIPLLRDIAEQDIGLRIFFYRMPSNFAEIYAYTEQLGGCMAINVFHPEERRRWSLAHAYWHFLTTRHAPHISGDRNYHRNPADERGADTFARYFLMPTSGLTRRFNDIKLRSKVTPAALCTLAHYYGVSLEALTGRIETMRLLPSGTWERMKGNVKVGEMRRQLGLKDIPASDQKLPLRYQYLALEALKEGKITEGQFAKFLEVDRFDARRIAVELGYYDDDTPDRNQLNCSSSPKPC